MENNIIIFNKSNFFQQELFKSIYLDRTHLIKVHKQHIEYIVSPYEDHFTFNVNISRRSILHRRIIQNILNQFITSSNLVEDVTRYVLTFIGFDINDIYINCKLKRSYMYSIKSS